MNQRLTQLLIATVTLTSASGCKFLEGLQHRRDPALPVVFEQPPSLEQLTESINENTSRLKQLEAHVTVSLDGLPNLNGNLALERPRNLRLRAGVMGIAELGVDIGSNDELFWVWSRASGAGAGPVLIYARHQEFAESDAAKQLPIQPQWIVQALGLVTSESSDQHQLGNRRPDGRIEIRTTLRTTRETITRVVVVEPRSGAIRQLALYDQQGKRIAYANAMRYQFDAEQQVKIPRYVEVYFPDPAGGQVKLAISLRSHKINQLSGEPKLLWKMPQPADVKTIDISRIPIAGRSAVPGTGQANFPGANTAQTTRTAGPPRGYQYR